MRRGRLSPPDLLGTPLPPIPSGGRLYPVPAVLKDRLGRTRGRPMQHPVLPCRAVRPCASAPPQMSGSALPGQSMGPYRPARVRTPMEFCGSGPTLEAVVQPGPILFRWEVGLAGWRKALQHEAEFCRSMHRRGTTSPPNRRHSAFARCEVAGADLVDRHGGGTRRTGGCDVGPGENSR